jgi:hypothetical protein
MTEGLFESRIRLLSTGFRFSDRPLSYGRAELFPDRIRLAAWRDAGSRLVIPIEEITDVIWPESNDQDTVFHLKNGDSFSLKLAKHARWRSYLESRIAWRDRSPIAHPRKAGEEWTLRDIVHYNGSMS